MKHELKALILTASIVISVIACLAFTAKSIASENTMWSLGCFPFAFITALVWQWFSYKN